ncbi:MAG: Lipid-A-disaccharide synthase [Syntrophorhabdus sp. PtaB.Bin184]|nr:MAG: Lipid-A-disaccharide synthase [Syntrophorhabdus sp. PtaB.Bin184]
MGSERLAGSGVTVVRDYRDISVTGLSEVLSHAGNIRRAFDTVKAHIRNERPDLVILVDFPGFNMRIASFARSLGVPVVYFIPPQVWAWKKGRLKKIRKCVDMVICILPFEEDLYAKSGIPAVYVGHPFAETVRPSLNRDEFLARMGVPGDKPILTVMPGSRRNEIRRHMPVLTETAGIMRRSIPGLTVLLPLADNIDETVVRPFLEGDHGFTVLKGNSHDALAYCDAAIVASGSATLEAALLGSPTAIIYRISRLSYAIARLIVHVDFIGLPNIVAGKEVFPEFIQRLDPETIARKVISMIDKGRQGVAGELGSIVDKLKKEDSYRLAANAILRFFERT